MASKRIFQLDFIRAAAILLVITFHYNLWLDKTGVDGSIFNRYVFYECGGWLGISLFIILSGASLMLSTKETFSLKDFYKKRFMAIFPLYWVTYLFVFIAFIIMKGHIPHTDKDPRLIILTVTGLDGFLLYQKPNFYIVGEWFVGFIIIMYIFFPVLRAVVIRSFTLSIAFAGVISFASLHYSGFGMSVHRVPMTRFFEFVFGMALIYYLVNPTREPDRRLTAAMGVFTVILFLVLISDPHFTAGILCLAALWLLSSLFTRPGSQKVITFISRYSFGAFLIHHVLIRYLLTVIGGRGFRPFTYYMLFLLCLVSTFIVSFLLTNAASLLSRDLSGRYSRLAARVP